MLPGEDWWGDKGLGEPGRAYGAVRGDIGDTPAGDLGIRTGDCRGGEGLVML